MKLPRPRDYNDWHPFAEALVKALEKSEDKPVAKTRSYTVATAPPPVEDGMVIHVSNEVGGATLAVSYGGVWKRVKDGAAIA